MTEQRVVYSFRVKLGLVSLLVFCRGSKTVESGEKLLEIGREKKQQLPPDMTPGGLGHNAAKQLFLTV